ATVEGSRHGQSLHTTVFRTHARPPQGWWYCHVLVAHLPTDDRRNESNPARLSQCLPECVGLATCDLEWIMMGSKGPFQQPDTAVGSLILERREDALRLWPDRY